MLSTKVKFNQSLFFKFNDGLRYINCEEMPYLDKKVNINDLINGEKIISVADIAKAKAHFANNSTKLRFYDRNGRKYMSVICLNDPEDKTNRLFAIYKGAKLGSGSYGKVGLMQDIDSGEWFAIKKYKYDPTLSAEDADGPIKATNAMDEYENLRLLHQSQGATELICKDNKHHQYLVSLSYAPGISLREYINSRPDITPLRWLQIAVSLLKSVRELHKLHYLHRDINPNNIIVDLQTSKVRLIDFGFMTHSLRASDGYYYGTEGYISDDVKLHHVQDVKSDIFSVGKTLMDFPGWQKITDPELKNKVLTYIEKLCSQDPKERPTLAQAINYLMEVQNEFVEAMEKVKKVGIVNIKELMDSKNTDNFSTLINGMRKMDTVWLFDTEQRTKKDYLQVRRMLESYCVNVGNKLFTVTDPSFEPVEIVRNLPDLCISELKEQPHSLFYLTNKALLARDTYKLSSELIVSLKANDGEDVIEARVVQQHLLREEYNYVQRLLKQEIKKYNDAYTKTNFANENFKIAATNLGDTLHLIEAEFNKKTLSIKQLRDALNANAKYDSVEFELALAHIAAMEAKYAPKNHVNARNRFN